MFIKSYLDGIIAYSRAIRLVFRYRLYYFFLVPVVFIFVIHYFGLEIFDNLKSHEIDFIYSADYASLNNNQLQDILYFALNLLGIFIFKNFWSYIVLFGLIPLNTFISMKTDSIITKNKFPFSWKQLIDDIKRSAIIIFRNMVIWIMLVYAIQLCMDILISATEVNYLDYVTIILTQLVGFYFYGYSMVDYTLERFRLSVQESNKFVWKNKYLIMGIGTVYGLVFQIPGHVYGYSVGNFVGVILGPVLGVVAATIAMHQIVDLSTNRYIKQNKVKQAN